jgi:DNA-binding transcriptional ArsR family regulator
LRAISEPRRREILRALLRSELSAGAVAERFPDVTRPAISQHLRVLKDAGLVSERRSGTRRLYRVHPQRLARLRAYLDSFWGTRLEALREAAERETRRRT